MRSYEIHDNGGRPFRVDIQGKDVAVWKNMNTFRFIDGKYTEITHPPKQILQIKADEIFIGKKSPSPHGSYDGLSAKEAEGNSILLRTGDRFVYIGHDISAFAAMPGDTIKAFYSDIGNNDVPYPYAVGKDYIYIMLDKVAVDIDFFDLHEHIYTQYYDADVRIPMCLRGYGGKNICEDDKKAAKARVAELKAKTKKLKIKILQKRLVD
jgi:hypothetical protein